MYVELRPYGRDGAKRLQDAAIRLADANTDDEHRRAVASLVKAAQRLRRKRKDIVRKSPDDTSRG